MIVPDINSSYTPTTKHSRSIESRASGFTAL